MTLNEKGASTNSITQSVQSKYPARRHPPLVELQWQNQADAQGSQNAINQSTGNQSTRQSAGTSEHSQNTRIDDQKCSQSKHRKSFILQTIRVQSIRARQSERGHQTNSNQDMHDQSAVIQSTIRAQAIRNVGTCSHNTTQRILARDRQSQHS